MRILLSALALACLVAVARGASAEMSGPAAREQVEAVTAAAQAELRRRAGPQWSVKSSRADRVLAAQPAPGDLPAMEAEAAARGRGESAIDLAALHAARRDRYLAGLARLDGARVRAVIAIARGGSPAAALQALRADADAALAALPEVE